MNKESQHQRVLRIKNMVCPRCIMVVQDELEKIGLHVLEVALGTAVVSENDPVNETIIKTALAKKGFELLHDKREELVERVKLTVIDLIYSEEISSLATNLSTYLAEKLEKDYATISTVFKAVEGVALSRYIVLQKIERAKELLTYDELPLNTIATRLGYKSLQHLSRQFKEVTGITLNNYKKQDKADRRPIDNLY